ncbi:hypothetical protein LTR50_003005 [Elasticomyces elasticus]|nr:hypothetical protein LTR50_003005 [Elasticomyces elasticus]
MPMPGENTEEQVKQGTIQTVKAWGDNSLPPTLLATLVTAQHFRPFQPLPMIFPPILLFSTYLNLSGYKAESAGVTSAWSALYMLLASRRKQQFTNKFGVRGVVRGATLALCAANTVGGGVAYAFGRSRED